jgi:cation:H+ antiporter
MRPKGLFFKDALLGQVLFEHRMFQRCARDSLNTLFLWSRELLTFWPSVILFLLVGIAGLKHGADGLINGSSNLGLRLGMTPILTGLTIVAFGTSAPELVVSAISALNGNPEICVANVIGSNLANTLLILGSAAAIAPFFVNGATYRRDGWAAALGTLLLFVLLHVGSGLSRWDGLLLLGAFCFWIIPLIREGLSGKDIPLGEAPPERADRPWVFDALLIGLGLSGLILGAQALVTGAVEAANQLGVPKVLVGLTIVAIGTSLPELAVSILASLQGKSELTLGNVLGSNVFNLLLILGIVALIQPIVLTVQDLDSFDFDFPVLLVISLLIIPFLKIRTHWSRVLGITALLAYGGYLAVLVTKHV